MLGQRANEGPEREVSENRMASKMEYAAVRLTDGGGELTESRGGRPSGERGPKLWAGTFRLPHTRAK